MIFLETNYQKPVELVMDMFNEIVGFKRHRFGVRCKQTNHYI